MPVDTLNLLERGTNECCLLNSCALVGHEAAMYEAANNNSTFFMTI